ncbi:MAG TPA: CehA/McbA family metallohydrolase, partial [Pirellulales bacterium]
AAGKQASLEVALPQPGYVVAKITDAKGAPSACKVQFTGRGETPTPNFGPDSAIHGVRNVYYTADGKFRLPLTPGEYDVIVSYGPEYDAIFTTLTLAAGKEASLTAALTHTVDTTGWLSGDFHSHSTLSGDNTCSQRGRVLNLLAEQIEFAPCTEHNRITVYTPHIEHFDAASRMLSCPGMELTGRPLPLNHQNAFPLTPKPRTQDGGAPKPDQDPAVQIERLAMWENASDKLVQINHPNLVQMVGDRDLNGSPDGGFEKMFSFMDVVEIHPPYNIFSRPEALPTKEREASNTIFHWLQLLNLGYRLPGVVNTDAHWNFHGSGWLRNYVKSKTDEPAKASVSDLVHECEHGHVVVTNGPFLEATAKAEKGGAAADVGDDLSAPGGKLLMKIRVQCPNWVEVNRVQIFVNGVANPKLNFTRQSHPAKFHQGTIVFDEAIPVELTKDAILVVACAGEGKQLGPVVGPDHAKEMPTALGNPIFVDVDGDGFKPNGDMLGLPLPVDPKLKPSKPHKH